MLIVARNVRQGIAFNDVEVYISEVKGKTVRLGIKGPREVKVSRVELIPSEMGERVSLTKGEIMDLLEYPTVYTSEGDGLCINVNRFENGVNKLFGAAYGKT